MAPTLFALIPRNVVRKQTVAEGLLGGSWVRQIRGGLSMMAIAEYLTVWNAVQEVQLNDEPDKLVWKWSSDGMFSVHSAYDALPTQHLLAHSSGRRGHRCASRCSCGLPSDAGTGRPIAGAGTGWRRASIATSASRKPRLDHIVVSCSFSRQVWRFVRQALGSVQAMQEQDTTGRHGRLSGQAAAGWAPTPSL